MKKKLVFSVIVLVIVCALCLTACNNYSSQLQDIQALLKVSYSEITLNVTTTASGIELKGIYTLTFEDDKTIVNYSFDRLNDLSLDGDNADTYLTKVTGTVEVVDGEIVNGDTSVTLPDDIDFHGMSFKQAFFKNCTMTGAKFDADVVNTKGFTGYKNFVCTDMHVTVVYNKKALSKIAITYVSEEGSDVSITYLFTK